MRSVNSANVSSGWGERWSSARYPGRSGSNSLLIERKNRSILPLPCGLATAEYVIVNFSSSAVAASWWLVKSLP